MKNTCKHDTSILMEFLNQRAQQSAETNYSLRDRDPPINNQIWLPSHCLHSKRLVDYLVKPLSGIFNINRGIICKGLLIKLQNEQLRVSQTIE